MRPLKRKVTHPRTKKIDRQADQVYWSLDMSGPMAADALAKKLKWSVGTTLRILRYLQRKKSVRLMRDNAEPIKARWQSI